ncbi:MAG: fasciclin domain-containing protein [Egibacteraceae bacterium]
MNITNRHGLAGALVVLALTAAGCGGGNQAAETNPEPAPAPANPPVAEPAESDVATTASGPACAQLPQGDAAGGLTAMAVQPAGTAASTNPMLTTLVSAVQKAELVDTLNGPGPFTIFAPVDTAFAKVPEADLNAVLADKATLTKTLTYHVHSGEALTSDKLVTASSLKMVNDGQITLAQEGEALEVNGEAKVVCSDIKVGNGVVHLIDTVLMPSA